MKCYKCPMIKEQFDNRIKKLDGSSICGLIYYDEAEYDHIDYCYCDKMGADLYMGRCTDAERLTEEEWDKYREEHDLAPILHRGLYDDEEQEIVLKGEEIDPVPEPTKKQKKRLRDERYKERLKRLSEYSGFSGAYPVGEDGYYDNENPIRYKRIYNPPRAKWLKRDCNKRIRRHKDVVKRSGYKKQSEYSWRLW